ncbi:serine/threonine-protein kinase MPS1-like [Bidens hawaiensis]|uniref:serine/threonine-protein kinase MPS1-like n=1 Tax=Bidens hawaiensis TaxID=980011 RepID=UPI00404A8668
MDSRQDNNLPSDLNLYRSFNAAATSSSSSSFNSSPPDFLRNVQAAFKRHRMPNLQPRRLVVPRRELSSKSSGVVTDSKTDESHDASVNHRVQDSSTLMKSTMTVNYESASTTPPLVTDTPTEEGKFMSIDGQRGRPGFGCDCRINNMIDLPCSKCRDNNLVDGLKKVQIESGNDTQPHETECVVNNQSDVLTAPNHDVNHQNFENQVNPLRNFLRSEFGHQVTSSSVVGSTCATTLVNSVNAPILGSTTCNSQPSQLDTRDPPQYNNKIVSDRNLVNRYELASGQQVKEAESSSTVKDPSLVAKSTKINDQSSKVTSVTLKSEKTEEPASKKDAAAPRKRKYDPDVFFKVNGKLYQRLGKIGSGGSSEVYKVISQHCSIYALKKIKLKGRDYGTAFGFCQEIEYLNKLKGKDHIIQLIDYEVTDKTLLKEVMSGSMTNKSLTVKEDGFIYMVLEYGEVDLAHMLSQKWRELDDSKSTIDEDWLRFYWKQILLAVKTIHEERIVHSDLKPANFLLVRGSLKLIDFGIAKAIMSDTTNIQRDSQVGTLSYMSPEAFLCNETDADGNIIKCGRPSDIWSLGCILYQMVYGRTPFADYTSFWAKFKEITDPNHEIKYESLPNPWLTDLMKKCLVWDRKERWTIPQLLQHPFIAPKVPSQLPHQHRDFSQLVADSCNENEDSETSMIRARLQQVVNNPMPGVNGSVSLDKMCSLLDEMSKLCIQLKEKLLM